MTVEFDETKKRLGELAQVINEFKSEAVQLKVLEWILDSWGTTSPNAGASKPLAEKKPTKKRKKTLPSEASDEQSSKSTRSRSTAGRPGPGKTVDRLISEGFFKSHRTMSAIMDYCKEKYALIYDGGDLSPTLGRAIRAGKLEREKNQDSQYEYFEP
jgi:hypothetical protein